MSWSETEEEVFNLCSDPSQSCPRDVQFNCEKFIEYCVKEKSRKACCDGSDQDQTQKTILAVLSAHLIHPLVVKSASEAKKFYCSECTKILNSVQDCLKHLLEFSHQTKELMHRMEFTRQHLPEPSDSHCIYLTKLLNQLVKGHGLSTSELERRRGIVRGINQQLREEDIQASLTICGSSETGMGFKDSDLNTLLSVHVIPRGHSTGRRARPTPGEQETFSKTAAFFQSHNRTLRLFTCPQSKRIIIDWKDDVGNGSTCLTVSRDDSVSLGFARLFSNYASVSSLLRPLVLGFRMWAKLCEVDDGLKEGLPPYTITCLAIYFLQVEGLLPVLDSSSLEVVQPAAGVECNTESPAYLGLLWLKMLKFYSSGNIYDTVISINNNKSVKEGSMERRIAIEQPLSSNPTKKPRHTVSSQMTSYILERLAGAYLYFSIPRTARAILYHSILPSDQASSCSPYVFHKFSGRAQSSGDDQPLALEPVDLAEWDLVSLAEELEGAQGRKRLEANPFRTLEAVKVRMLQDHRKNLNVLVDDVAVLSDLLPHWMYRYEFDKNLLTQGQRPPVYCKSCQSRKHYVLECPDERLPQPLQLPRWTANRDFLHVLNIDVLKKNYEIDVLKPQDVEVRREIVSDLQEALTKIYPNGQLYIFGSSANGFGTAVSDIDLCLLFNRSAQEENLPDPVKVITAVQKMLYKLKKIEVTCFVRHARIPIVKFRHLPSKLEGDISCSNPLAIHNSQLLRKYSEIDERVKTLGYFFKKLVKICDISSAAKATLSSYGHTLLVIYFLQQLENPVVPVLQEIQQEPAEMVNGWNVQYFKDIQNVIRVWPEYGRNRDSPAELWMKFLKFYTEEFDFEENVISIRQKGVMTRLSKLWISESLIAIEDPFELSHNVGGSMSRQKSVYILRTFWRFREVFHAAASAGTLKKEKSWLEYFTDANLIRLKAPSRAKKCALCHHPGHVVRDCPRRTKKRKIADSAVTSATQRSNNVSV